MSDLDERFGARLADALGPGPSEGARAAQRAELLLRFHRERHARDARRWPFFAFAFAGATLAAILLVPWLLVPSEQAVSARFQGHTVVLEQPLKSGAAASDLDFSDGSRVQLQPNSDARITELVHSGARVVLENGSLTASVEHRATTSWTVFAGPYRVHVVGTLFHVLWNARTERFVVDVSRGEVRVSGGDLPPGGVSVKQHERLERGTAPAAPPKMTEVSPEPPLVGSLASAGPTPLAEASPMVPSPLLEPPHGAPARAPGNPTRPASRSEQETWQSLAARGMYVDALSAAEKQGLTQLLARESAADLLLLGNSARFASRSEPARRAYLSLRERFPETTSASLSAYYLARLAGDLDKNSGEAVRWLRVFLAESPRGDLAASARARLMDLLRKQGDALGARSVARQYLELHPTGPHAELARSILAAKSP